MSYRTNNYIHVDIEAAHNEVTGSCFLCTVQYNTEYKEKKVIRFIVDCGLFQEVSYDNLNKLVPIDIENIDFALITHAHADHTGRIPFFVKKGFKGKIFTTKLTCKLMYAILKNSAHIHEQNAKLERKEALYTSTNIEPVFNLVEKCDFNVPIKVMPNITVTFLMNAHLLGSSMILIEITSPANGDKINLLFTGDYRENNELFEISDSLTERILQLPLTIIQEATYGNTTSDSIEYNFRKYVEECIKSDQFILIPAFSMERTQRILYEIKCMQEEELIPLDYEILLDGVLSKEMTLIYENEDNVKDFIPKNFEIIAAKKRQELLSHLKDKTILITSSGMGTHGPAQVYIPKVLAEKNASIIFTGYLAEGTTGRKIKDSTEKSTISIFGKTITKRAKVFFVEEFSSHAKADQLLNFLKKFNNIKYLIINHGSKENKKNYYNMINKNLKIKNVSIAEREEVYRVDRYGFVKKFLKRTK